MNYTHNPECGQCYRPFECGCDDYPLGEHFCADCEDPVVEPEDMPPAVETEA